MNQTINNNVATSEDKEQTARRVYVAPELRDLSNAETKGKGFNPVEATVSGTAS